MQKMALEFLTTVEGLSGAMVGTAVSEWKHVIMVSSLQN